ncbi:MAG: hypothetical protein H6Q07_2176 [Acidobacteria bacterium]|nr:hypothetical protein [Acidobacteriota bacterium]
MLPRHTQGRDFLSHPRRSVGFLDVLSNTPAGPSVALAGKPPDAPCIHARLHRLAAKTCEKCGVCLPSGLFGITLKISTTFDDE